MKLSATIEGSEGQSVGIGGGWARVGCGEGAERRVAVGASTVFLPWGGWMGCLLRGC